MSSKVVISKAPSVAVGPSEQVEGAGGDTIVLSSYDKLFARTVAAGTVFLVFEHPIHDPVETIKTGLSRALIHYYPISGRLAPAANGGFVINCSGEGVSFVAASASCTMKAVRSKLSDPSVQDQLAIFYPVSTSGTDSDDSYSQPLLLVQVTVFSCGGFVLGVTWDHAVSDGLGLAQFLQAIGEMARGAPSPSVVPVRTSDALALDDAPPPFYAEFMQFMTGSLQPCPMAFLSVTVPSSLTMRVQQDYARRYRGRRCSAFDVVAAVLWRCRTRATMSGPEALSVLVYAENMRKHAGAREGYYGNCLTARPIISVSGTVASMDVVELLEMIRREKERAPGRSDMDRLRAGQLNGYDLLRVSSWRGIGLDAPDFGGGKPVRVMGNWRDRTSLPLCASLPCKDDYYNVISMFVREEHVRAFRRELAMMIQVVYDPLVSGSVSRL